MLRNGFKVGLGVGVLSLMFVMAPSIMAAPIQNGGFESFTDFANWTTLGNTSIQDNNFKTPTEGTVQALLSNGNNGPGVLAATTNVAGLDAFMNLGANSLEVSNIKSGSAIKQSFTGTAGDVIKFDYNFLTNEVVTVRADWAIYTISGAGSSIGTLGLPDNPLLHNTNPLDNLNSYFAKETGYQTFTYTLPATGAYTLAFAVTNAVDTTISSGLLIDNVTQNGVSPVPLPMGMYVLPLGLAVAGLFVAKNRRMMA